jgi:hypothetical protein
MTYMAECSSDTDIVLFAVLAMDRRLVRSIKVRAESPVPAREG